MIDPECLRGYESLMRKFIWHDSPFYEWSRLDLGPYCKLTKRKKCQNGRNAWPTVKEQKWEKKRLPIAVQCEYWTLVNFSSNLPHGGIWRSRSQLSAKESLSQIFSFYLTTGNLRVKCTWSTDCTWNNVFFFTFNSFDMFRKVPR